MFFFGFFWRVSVYQLCYTIFFRTEKQDKISLSTDLSEKICRLHRLLHKDALPEDAQIRAQFYCPKPSSISRLQEHLDGQNQEKQGKLDAYVAGIKQEIDELQKLCFQSRCEVRILSWHHVTGVRYGHDVR